MDQRHQKTTPRILGLTGPIACGKTTVGDILLDLGALCRIDADQVVHELEGPGTDVTRQIGGAFGHVLQADGAVDRACLAARVFSNPDALRRLEDIVHPAVRQEVRRRIEELHSQSGIVVVDAVKLLQSDLLPLVETVWVVWCSPEKQLHRLSATRGMADSEAEGRLRAQPNFDHPAVGAVIDNSGTVVELRDQVASQWRLFQNLTDAKSR